MSFYATRNSHKGDIGENAKIVNFGSQAEAKAWLFAGHSSGLFPRVAVGSFLGHWRRTDSLFPTEVLKTCAPFKLDEIDTKGPDDHHVGTHFEHTPTPDVLVLVDDDSERSSG